MQPEQVSGVFVLNKRVRDSPTGCKLARTQRGQESALTEWVLNSTAMKTESVYMRPLPGIWDGE